MFIKDRIKEKVARDFLKTRLYPKKNIVDKLLTDRPFDFSPAWKKAFFEAMRWGFVHHAARSKFYARLCAERGFGVKDLRSFDDIWDIPFILCDVFKHYDIDTGTNIFFRTELTSSGTSGRKSKIFLDIISGQRLLHSAYHIYKALGMESQKPTNYILMAYNPDIDKTRATTVSDVVISYLAPEKKVFYGIDLNDRREVEFLKSASAEKLREFMRDGAPIRILGFLHHTCEMIRAYRAKYGKAIFPKDSCVLSGGGWKGFVGMYGPDFDLFGFLKENTNVDLENVRDLYTLNEHAVFYLQCKHHNMHIPNVSLACVRDPRTMKRLPYGERGLVHLYSPLVESTPLLSILTTDYGVIHESCTCPIGGPYIKILGRAGITKKTTCALTAEQYIKSAV